MYSCWECGEVSPEEEIVNVPADEQALRQWAELYDLDLGYRKDSTARFVCKKHVSERTNNGEESLMDDEDEFSMEVKQEIDDVEEVAMEDGFDTWKQAKDEPIADDDDYGQFSFEMGQNSYTSYEQASSYQLTKYEDEQPTTSTAHNDYEQQVCYPEFTDNQILALCVKVSGLLSGVSSVECSFCQEVFCGTSDIQSIRIHLQQKHKKVLDAILAGETLCGTPKLLQPMKPAVSIEADKMLCKFLISNGLPLKTVGDKNLEMLAFNFNPNYSMPTVEKLFEYAQEIGDEKQNSLLNSDGSIRSATATFDTTKFNNINYIAFTISYHREGAPIKRSLFLREFEPIQPIVPSIISIIKQTAEEYGLTFPITSIVSGKAEYEVALEKTGCFKQVMVCFSQNINRFAEALVRSPVFARPLNTLRDFIRKFPLDKALFNKFKQFIVKRRTYGEYPEVDDENWITTIDFITKCLHMHRLFSEFICSSQKTDLVYIGVADNVNIVYLHSLLNVCKSTLKNMVTTQETISGVVPAIADINSSISVTTSRPEIVQEVQRIFRSSLMPFIEQSDVHRFAFFLNPYHYGSEILPTDEWESIQEGIIRQLSSRDHVEKSLSGRLGKTRGLSTLKDTVTAENEVMEYIELVHRIQMESITLMDWWARHSKRFPRMSEYARELFQIPAFSIDASHYLGEYGIMSHAVQDLDSTKRKIMLRASSELVKIHCQGELMTRTICVKRPKDTSRLEDAWYNPIDIRAVPLQNPKRNEASTLANDGLKRMTMGQGVRMDTPITTSNIEKPTTYPRKTVFPRTLKQEIQKMETMRPRIIQRKYTLGPAVPKMNGMMTDTVIKCEEMPTVIKTEEGSPIAPTPVLTKKYYTVRPGNSNASRPLIPAVNRNSRFLTGTSSTVMHPIIVRNGVNAPQTKKVYVIRQRTGPVPQPFKNNPRS